MNDKGIISMKHVLGVMVILLHTFLAPVYGQSDEETFTAQNYSSEVSNVGTSAAAFLEIGVGANSQALGGAFTAVANDVSALYWNPAGITQIQQIAISANYTQWLAGTAHEFVGIVIPFSGRFVTGISLNVLNYMDKQPVRTILLPEGTGEYYGASDIAMTGTVAATITDRFSIGLSGKYIMQQLWHEKATTLAMDIGVLYRTRWDGLNIGTTIANYGSGLRLEGRDLRRPFDADQQHYSNDRINIMLETDAFPLPLLFRFGLSYEFSLMNVHHILIATDLNHPSNNVESVNLGGQWSYRNLLILRAGYESLFDDSAENGLTAGFGVTPTIAGRMKIAFNYSWSEWGLLGNVQRFSIDMHF